MANGAWRVQSRATKFRTTKLILEAESCLSRIFAPPKITRYTVFTEHVACLQHTDRKKTLDCAEKGEKKPDVRNNTPIYIVCIQFSLEDISSIEWQL